MCRNPEYVSQFGSSPKSNHCSLDHVPSFQKISSKSIHNFWDILHTDTQAHTHRLLWKHIIFPSEKVINHNILTVNHTFKNCERHVLWNYDLEQMTEFLPHFNLQHRRLWETANQEHVTNVYTHDMTAAINTSKIKLYVACSYVNYRLFIALKRPETWREGRCFRDGLVV